MCGNSCAPLKGCSRLVWTKDAQAALLEDVYDAIDQRGFRSYDRQIYVIALGKHCELVYLVDTNLYALCIWCHAGIARRGVELGDTWALRQLPDNGMLARARSND